MERLAYQALKSWKANPSRKPLLVQGARQVGKTYLLRDFACREYMDYVYLNFEETPDLSSLFSGDLNPSRVIEAISAFQAKTVRPESMVLIFDEIQTCPRAITSLKYFNEQAPQYHIMAAGSLLGVSVGKTTSFPVGNVNFLNLYPLTFFEFLTAMGEDRLGALLKENSALAPIPDALHNRLSELLRLYMFLGGMPEAVQSYIRSKDLIQVRNIQKEILKAYERDFSKYTTPTQAVRVGEIWRSIPSHLARENKKFKYSAVKKNGRAVQFESAVEWLRSAGLILKSINITRPQLPLSGQEDFQYFKVYLLDCGLLGAMVDNPPRTMVQGDMIFSEYNGAFVENLVAAELAHFTQGELHYWISEGIAEVDFIVVYEESILPLEVKSGLNRNIKSLRVYADKFKPSGIYRTSPRNFDQIADFVNIPLYAIGLFPESYHRRPGLSGKG
ncbi:MAG: DUF4143 domain-containing protein [Desulfobacteraceae bacterium]|nr:MAG: DUF4143 domain-containing protein [Desulfobacteraceae bacterium]